MSWVIFRIGIYIQVLSKYVTFLGEIDGRYYWIIMAWWRSKVGGAAAAMLRPLK